MVGAISNNTSSVCPPQIQNIIENKQTKQTFRLLVILQKKDKESNGLLPIKIFVYLR
jgi:hypothetical protein